MRRRVHPDRHVVELADGSEQPYDKLLLATGSSPRRLPVAGADAPSVLHLRRKGDSDAIRATFGAGKRLVIIGGGWIGLEVAAAARQAGTDVTVLEAAALPLLAVLGPELAQVFAELHREHGVDLRTGVQVAEILRRRRQQRAAYASPTARSSRATPCWSASARARRRAWPRRPASPSTTECWSTRRCAPAIRTSTPRATSPAPSTRGSASGYASSTGQTRSTSRAVAAAGMLGETASYDLLPYFYTDQYDLGMEYTGNAPAGTYDQVVIRGKLETREFIAFWLDAAGHVLAGMNVNVWDVTDPIKALIESRRRGRCQAIGRSRGAARIGYRRVGTLAHWGDADARGLQHPATAHRRQHVHQRRAPARRPARAERRRHQGARCPRRAGRQ